MKYQIIFCVLLVSFLGFQSCNLLGDDDEDCTLTAFPVTDATLTSGDNVNGDTHWIATAVYKTPKNSELYWSIGSCNPDDVNVNWDYTGEYEIVSQNNLGTMSAIFYTSGTLCGQFVGSGKATAQACQQIKVIKDNVWTTAPEYSGKKTINSITLKINNAVYTGFGNTNEWYKLDTLDFSWQEKANISGPVQFASFGGFSLNGKGYIVGNNSNVYEYDPNADTWTSIGTFPVNVAEYLQLSVIAPDAYIYSILGVSAGNKGYYGLGNLNRLWEFDPTTKTWTEKASHPEIHEFANHIFSYKSKIYSGDHYYDIASDQWIKNNINFNYESGFGSGFVEIDGLMYGSHSGKTITYDGNNYSFYEPREREPFEPFAPLNLSGQGVVLGNVAIFPRPNSHPSIYKTEANNRVFVYRK
jgi:hypothetical protein